MSYDLTCWPPSVFRKEVEDLPPDIRAPVMVALARLKAEGPKPIGYSNCKNLGKKMGSIWQLALRTTRGEQMRILYFVKERTIFLLSVFKKTSPALQKRAYDLALDRQRGAETAQ